MAIGATRVKGLVDRVCEMDGRVALIDFKTNASLDHALLEAYTLQLRIYGLAARRGLLPGGREPRLILFDLRRGETIDAAPDAAFVERRVRDASRGNGAGHLQLGADHAQTP